MRCSPNIHDPLSRSQLLGRFYFCVGLGLTALALAAIIVNLIQPSLASDSAKKQSKMNEIQNELGTTEGKINSLQPKIKALAENLNKLPESLASRVENFSENTSEELLRYFYNKQSQAFDSSISYYLKK